MLLGLTAVALGIKEKWNQLLLPGFSTYLRTLWDSRFGANAQSRPVTVALTGVGARAETGILSPSQEATVDHAIEQRLAVIEANLSSLKHQYKGNEGRVNEKIRELNEAIDKEQRARADVTKKLGERFEGFAGGNLRVELAGLVFLVSGVTFATLSPKIDRLLKWAFT